MIEVSLSIFVDAPPERVAALYADVPNWPRLFPRTIRGAHILRESPDETAIEVDHVEGKVLNLLRPTSTGELELVEFKRRYDATFRNAFQREGKGTRYVLTARIRIKGVLRWISRFATPLIRSRMRRYVLEPVKAAAEKAATAR